MVPEEGAAPGAVVSSFIPPPHTVHTNTQKLYFYVSFELAIIPLKMSSIR